MAITAKQLADGQLPAAQGDLYTSTGVITYIVSIVLHNTNTTTENCTLWVLPSGGTARVIAYVELGADETFYFNERRTLDSGDKIQGDATNATQVDYSIDGATEA